MAAAMKGWIKALSRTRDAMRGGVARMFRGGGAIDPADAEAWEEALIQADIPPRLAMEWVESAASGRGEDIVARLEDALVQELGDGGEFQWTLEHEPTVVLVVGVNGSGKTTTSAKLAAMAARHGLRPLLAAADTFRAAGADQLRIWAERVGCEVVAGTQGGDAAAVAFDAVEAAAARGSQIVFVDTAGRMHTKQPLMEELRKLERAVGKAMEGAPHERWIVLDASMGNNAIEQARVFNEAVGLTGVIVSKLDGSSRAGFLLAVRKELGVPVLFAGLGERAEDLVPFVPREFVRALMGSDEAD